MDEYLQCANVLWKFSRLNHSLSKSELMIVLGNDDPRSAEYAASLYKEGWAPFVLITGKEGTGTKGKLNKSEAEIFSDIMTSLGVPDNKILLELEATNTGENMAFSQRVLRQCELYPTSIILVTKSLMEMRAALTFSKQWEGSENIRLTVTSPPLGLQEYPSPHVGSMYEVVQYLMENFEKLTLYADKGHQAPVYIPPYVQRAYRRLVENQHGDKDI